MSPRTASGSLRGGQVCGEPAPHCLPRRPEGEGAAAQGWEAGGGLPAVLPLLALQLQPRRGLGLARAGAGVSQPHSFWPLRSPRRAGRRSPCSQGRQAERSAPGPGSRAASLASVMGRRGVACWGLCEGWRLRHRSLRPRPPGAGPPRASLLFPRPSQRLGRPGVWRARTGSWDHPQRPRGSPCRAARCWAAASPPAGSRPRRRHPSAGPPPRHASTSGRAGRSPTRCSRPPAGRLPARTRDAWEPPADPTRPLATVPPTGSAPGGGTGVLTAAWPPGTTAAMRTGESPRSVKPKPLSPRVTWTGPTSRQRCLAVNTDRGPWGPSEVRGWAAPWQKPRPMTPALQPLHPGTECSGVPGHRHGPLWGPHPGSEITRRSHLAKPPGKGCSPAGGRYRPPSPGRSWGP